MTISNTTRVAGPYTGNGTTTTFPFSFKIFKTDELLVVKTSPEGVETTLVLGVNYTAALNADQNNNPGGSVTLASALLSANLLTLTSQIQPLQPVDLTNSGGFYPNVINLALDRITILVQQLISKMSRAIIFPLSDGPISAALPTKNQRVGRLLAFDALTGNPSAGPLIASVDVLTANVQAVDSVAGSIDNVNSVSSSLGDIHNVLENTSNISECASISLQISELAPASSAIITCLENIDAINSAPAQASAANSARVGAESARVAAEAARDSLNTTGKVFTAAELAAGTAIAGTTNGQQFAVVAADLLSYGIYRNNAGSALFLTANYTKNYLDTVLPALFETLEPDLGTYLLDPANKILAQLPDPAIAMLQTSSVTSAEYETLDPAALGNLTYIDAVRKIMAQLASVAYVDAAAAAAAVPTASLGSRTTLTARLASGLTPYGDPIGPYANTWSLRAVRMLLRKLALGEAAQVIITLIGDSYTAGDYYGQALAKTLQTQYGNAGSGWIGFSWWGTASGTWTVGTQPQGVDGNIRPDIITVLQIIGTWTCSYNRAANNTPSLGKITSSTAGDYVRFTLPTGHNAAQLFYTGDGTGVVQVSWDDGATYSANIALNTVGAANVALAGVPATAQTARIKVISGNVALAGVGLNSAASGVRIHKLGASGSATNTWSTVTAATWRSQIASLGGHCHTVMFGTNDQGASFSTVTFAANLALIATNIKTALPGSDLLLAMPPENQRTTNAVGMPAYAQAAREYAVPNDIAFLDHQYFFGSPASFAAAYAFANAQRPWYRNDLIHPDTQTGGRVLADAFTRLITQH